LIAACVSQTVAGLSSENYPVSSGPLGRRLRRRIARSKKMAAEGWFPNVGIQAGALSGQNLVAFCESGLSELGSFCSLEGCPEYNSSKHSPLFGDGFLFGEGFGGLGSKPVRAARRRLSKAAAGMKIKLPSVFFTWKHVHVALSHCICAERLLKIWCGGRLLMHTDTKYASCVVYHDNCSVWDSDIH
jgi:hypothetical protein